MINTSIHIPVLWKKPPCWKRKRSLFLFCMSHLSSNPSRGRNKACFHQWVHLSVLVHFLKLITHWNGSGNLWFEAIHSSAVLPWQGQVNWMLTVALRLFTQGWCDISFFPFLTTIVRFGNMSSMSLIKVDAPETPCCQFTFLLHKNLFSRQHVFFSK